jgi:hypothetical protein
MGEFFQRRAEHLGRNEVEGDPPSALDLHSD